MLERNPHPELELELDASPLAEFAALEYILLGDLQDLLREPADETNRRWIVAVLDALLDTLPREQDLRDEGGYLCEVLEEFPSWFPQVKLLRAEHSVLFRKLRQLRSVVVRPQPFEEFADDVRAGLERWMTRLVDHHRNERDLVQSAFTLDVGCGD